MKNLVKSSVVFVLALTIIPFSGAKADSSANVKVSGKLPVLNNVTSKGGNLSANIAVENGQLSAALTPAFQTFTNNNAGVDVTFSIQAEASDNATINAMSGQNKSNEGKVILANSEVKPSSTGVINALGNNPQASQNANVIAYGLKFTGNHGTQAYNPVFNAQGTSATVKAPAGSTDFTVQISNNNSVLSGTYGSDSDLAGAYEATIYCTVATP